MLDWLQSFSDWLIYSVFQIAQDSKLGDALNFFVCDTIKILIFSFIITFSMAKLGIYFKAITKVEKVMRIIA